MSASCPASRPHSVTWCPRSTSTLASAVPQLPAPITATSMSASAEELSRLHTRPQRARSWRWRSECYRGCTDKQIVDAVCGRHGLTACYGDAPPGCTHDHVYQHNQSDFELLRVRAERSGRELYVDGTNLYFRTPDFSDSGVQLK